VKPKHWSNPTEVAAFIVGKEYGNQIIQMYIERSRYGQRIGARVAKFSGKQLVKTQKSRLEKRCSNNQA